MEQLLIWLVVAIVVGAIILALVNWAGITIDPVLYKVAGYLVVGIFLVVVIKLLWPFLMGNGSLPSLR